MVRGALERVEGVAREPGPQAEPWTFDPSSVGIKVFWWTDPQRSAIVRTRGRVILAVKTALGEAGVDLPFPTRTVLLNDQTEDTDGDRRRQREGWPAGTTPPRPRAPRSLEPEKSIRHGARPPVADAGGEA